MPGREIPLVKDQIYHVFNRGIAKQPIFLNKRDYQRFFDTLIYYQNRDASIRFSKLLQLSVMERNKIQDRLRNEQNFLIDFISFCLMPNHFHILLRQKEENGIAKFIANLSNSYTKYFNTKNKRVGPILQGKFKAVRIEDDEQLLHVTRYIHLNPYTSYLVKDITGLIAYPYSSLPEYLKLSHVNLVDKKPILSHFKTIKSFKEFTFNQADYQKKLNDIKHLVLEE